MQDIYYKTLFFQKIPFDASFTSSTFAGFDIKVFMPDVIALFLYFSSTCPEIPTIVGCSTPISFTYSLIDYVA